MNNSKSSYSHTTAVPIRSTEPKPFASTSTAHSPPRKVVTDFAAFGAPKTASVFGTAVASTPFSLAGNKAAFGSLRNPAGRGMEDEDEDEDEENDGRQRVFLKEDSITLEQVCKIIASFISMLIISAGPTHCDAKRMAEYASLSVLAASIPLSNAWTCVSYSSMSSQPYVSL